jgi:uridine monophosphate synthetase
MENTELYQKLVNCNCLKKGKFKLKNGETSEYYFDIKNVISHPSLLRYIGIQLFNILDEFDIICGIPYGALPIATYISTTYNKPLIYIRDKKKEYGTQKLIEGEYKKTDRCVIIDDVLTTGGSLQKDYDILKDYVNIVDTAVVVNRNKDYKIKSLIELN